MSPQRRGNSIQGKRPPSSWRSGLLFHNLRTPKEKTRVALAHRCIIYANEVRDSHSFLGTQHKPPYTFTIVIYSSGAPDTWWKKRKMERGRTDQRKNKEKNLRHLERSMAAHAKPQCDWILTATHHHHPTRVPRRNEFVSAASVLLPSQCTRPIRARCQRLILLSPEGDT